MDHRWKSLATQDGYPSALGRDRFVPVLLLLPVQWYPRPFGVRRNGSQLIATTAASLSADSEPMDWVRSAASAHPGDLDADEEMVGKQLLATP